MKKYILILFAVVILILAACARTEMGATGGSNASTTTGTPTQTLAEKQPTGTTQTPTTEFIVATQPPTTQQTENQTVASTAPAAKGEAFVYDGTNPLVNREEDLSECVEGCLYYINYYTEGVFLICEDPVAIIQWNDYMVFYVKTDEPNRIYGTPKYDFTQHTLIYESNVGAITRITTGFYQYENSSLTVLEANQCFTWIDLATGQSTVLVKQYYISNAYLDSEFNFDGLFYANLDVVYFEGKLNAEDPGGGYLYYRKTGVIVKENRH